MNKDKEPAFSDLERKKIASAAVVLAWAGDIEILDLVVIKVHLITKASQIGNRQLRVITGRGDIFLSKEQIQRSVILIDEVVRQARAIRQLMGIDSLSEAEYFKRNGIQSP